jgi:hypothetical protein
VLDSQKSENCFLSITAVLERGPRDSEDPMTDLLKAEAGLLEQVDLEVKEQKKNMVVEVKLKVVLPKRLEEKRGKR